MASSAAFPSAADGGRQSAASDEIFARPDAGLLGFVAEMHALQLDQLAALLTEWGEPGGNGAQEARELVVGWRAAGYVESDRLSLGEPWVWATRKVLDACGLRPRQAKPAVRILRHTHAVTDVRLAVQRMAAFRDGGAWWHAERSIRSDLGFPPRMQHVPDGEVHWLADSGLPWAGQVWAIEVEISPKTVKLIAEDMREHLIQIGECSKAFASAPAPGPTLRYARLVYVCSSTTVRMALKARAEVGSPLSARIDIYDLPESATRLNSPKRGWEP